MTLHGIRKRAWTGTFFLCLPYCIADILFTVHGVSGSSMAPTLSPDFHETGVKDYVIFSKLALMQGLSRGQIISFWKPHDPEELSVKRVVGTPGDTLYPDKRYSIPRVEVPYGHVWVEGDNARETVDSNDFGPISQNLITGRAMFVLWPFHRFGTRPWESFKVKREVIPGESELPIEYQN